MRRRVRCGAGWCVLLLFGCVCGGVLNIAQLVYAPPALDALFGAAESWAKSAGQDESAMIFMACPPPAFEPALVVIPFFNGPAAQARERFRAFFDVGPVVDLTREIPYEELNAVQVRGAPCT
jgi:hypothetical protein